MSFRAAKWLTLPATALAALAAPLMPSAASAETLIEESPTPWRLEINGPDSILISWTSSSCVYGRLIMGSSLTSADKDRLWSLILSAKLGGKKVGIAYNVSGSDCVISRFYMIEG